MIPLAFLAAVLPALPVVTIPTNTAARLVWDAAADPTVNAYRVYYATNSGAPYAATNDAGTNLSATITNLIYGQRYYFALTCLTSNGLESGYSAEISAVEPVYFEPTNVFTVYPSLLVRSNLNAPWSTLLEIPGFTFTQGPGNGTLYFSPAVRIAQTNVTKQVLRLNSHTLVITNQ